ncbi:MAG: hypothetical protein DCF29_15520 [Alphaproteobacteria bacterium]|nr:MAG: hypothetical protein DCF29_15520 [Alphaproteobacteria bacterium]
MSMDLALALSSAKPAGKRPYFMDPSVERVLNILMVTVQELAVTRERLDTIERLLEAKGVIGRPEIETFEPSADQAAERGLWMQEYLNRVLRTLQQEAEAVQAPGDLASEDVAVEISKATT